MFSSVNYESGAVKIFDCDEIPLEVVVEELIVTAKSKYFLLFELSNDEFVHLGLGDLALVEHVPDLLDCALHFDLELLFYHIEACLKHTFHLMRMANFDFLCLNF